MANKLKVTVFNGHEHILSKQDNEELLSAIKSAKRKAELKTITVKSHKRKFYRLSETYSRRLKRWSEVEDSLHRLASDIDRRKIIPGDKRRIKAIKEFIENLETY
jgi:DNA-binding PadR family transcriptional regulator